MESDAKLYAKQNNCKSFEVSALTTENLQACFDSLLQGNLQVEIRSLQIEEWIPRRGTIVGQAHEIIYLHLRKEMQVLTNHNSIVITQKFLTQAKLVECRSSAFEHCLWFASRVRTSMVEALV